MIKKKKEKGLITPYVYDQEVGHCFQASTRTFSEFLIAFKKKHQSLHRFLLPPLPHPPIHCHQSVIRSISDIW